MRRRKIDEIAPTVVATKLATRALNSDEERLIREVLEREYLKLTKPPFQRVLEQAGSVCHSKGWPATGRPIICGAAG